MPQDDAVAEHGPSGSMLVLTSLGLELTGELLRRDLYIVAGLLVPIVAIVAVVDHLEKVIESIIINRHAKRKDIISDGFIIIKNSITTIGPSIIIKKKAKDVVKDPGALARIHAPSSGTRFPDRQFLTVTRRR